MSKADTVLLGVILAVTLTAGSLIALEGGQNSAALSRAHEFQQLVGGLGFGPAPDVGRCEFGCDPRLCPYCSFDTGPIPGGVFFCPHHACSVYDYPPVGPQAEALADAVLP
jgi:hypothetical protein